MTLSTSPAQESEKPLLSIISPVYGAEGLVDKLVCAITSACSTITHMNYEIILVEDGSPDESWSEVEQAAATYPFVRGFKLSRNFGQHAAITAGLAHCRGDYVVVMDCDLQEDPAYLPELVQLCESEADIVLTRRQSREYSPWKNFCALGFQWVFNYLSETQQCRADRLVGTMSCVRRQVVDSFLRLEDVHRHYLLVLRWLGYDVTYLTVIHREREIGRSGYSFRKLMAHALDGIASQSTKMLRLSVGVGLFFCVAAALSVITLVSLYFAYDFKDGWLSVVSLILLCTGLLMFNMGVLGLYIGKIFEQSRGRPLFLVHRTVENAQQASSRIVPNTRLRQSSLLTHDFSDSTAASRSKVA